MLSKIKQYVVEADENTGEWLDEPQFEGFVYRAKWDKKIDTTRTHYDHYESRDGETRAIKVKWVRSNPAKRIGAAHPKRRSAATHAAPSKRLVRRRKENVKQGYFPNPIADKIALHFNAGNDTNGNQRRIFVVVDTRGNVLGAFDEGYVGNAAVTSHYPGIAIVGRFDITPAQRKTLLKDYGK